MFHDTKALRSDEIYLDLERTADAIPEKRWVPCYFFKIRLVSDSTEVGHCDFRVGNTEKLFFGGNIGYTVYPPHRGRHYAGKACRLLLGLARMHELRYIHITCDPDNTASRRTCEYAGGVLVAVVDLPTDNDLYAMGKRRECVYRFAID